MKCHAQPFSRAGIRRRHQRSGTMAHCLSGRSPNAAMPAQRYLEKADRQPSSPPAACPISPPLTGSARASSAKSAAIRYLACGQDHRRWRTNWPPSRRSISGLALLISSISPKTGAAGRSGTTHRVFGAASRTRKHAGHQCVAASLLSWPGGGQH